MLDHNIVKILRGFIAALLLSLIAGCSTYKSNWSCKNPEGLACTSVFHADEIARKHIVLNSNQEKKQKKKVLIKEHYADFIKYKTQVVEID